MVERFQILKKVKGDYLKHCFGRDYSNFEKEGQHQRPGENSITS